MYPPRAVTTTPVKINCRTPQSPLSRTQRLPLANVPPPTWGGSAHRVCCNHSSALHPVARRPQNGWHAAQAAMTPHPPRSVNVCVTSDIKQTAAAFRGVTVPRQEFCGVAFLLRGQTGRVALPPQFRKQGSDFPRYACACRTNRSADLSGVLPSRSEAVTIVPPLKRSKLCARDILLAAAKPRVKSR